MNGLALNLKNTQVINLTDEPINIIAARFINIGVKCPYCNKWNKPPIKVIKADCGFCNKPFEKDISVEDKEIYERELVKDYLYTLMDAFQTQDKFVYCATDLHMDKANRIALLLKPFGVEMTRVKVSKVNRKTGKTMQVNEVTFKKSEELLYFIEKK